MQANRSSSMQTPAPHEPAPTRDDAPSFVPASRVIRAEELGALGSARDLLAQAHTQSQALLDKARNEADAIRADAERLAAAEIKRGYAAGWEQAQRDAAESMTRSEAEQAKGLASQEERMCMLVTRTLGKVLAEQQNDERFFAGVMTRVLRAAREEKFLTVRVAAEQRDAAEKAIRQVIEQTAAPNFIEVLGDAALRRGACIVESAHGVIDASLDTQMDAIRSALLAVWRPEHG
jgi:type III secretion protein L